MDTKTRDLIKYVKISLIASGMTAYCLGIFTNYVADPDLWGYLAFGRLFWETGTFPYHDVFSYVPTKEIWVYHEWLTGAIFFPVYKYYGPMGLQLLKYAVILATIGTIYKVAVLKGGNLFSSILAIFLMANAMTYGYSPVRAQIFTYLLISLTIYILERYNKDHKGSILLLLLPINIIWCNLHGGFLAGLGIVFLYAAGSVLSGRRSSSYFLILIASFIVTFINPYGMDYWIYIFHAITMPRPDIFEWMSVPTAIVSGKYIEAGVLFISFLIISLFLVIRQRKHDLSAILVLSATAFIGFSHIRHTIFFFLAFGAFMPVSLTDFWRTIKTDPKKIKTPQPILKFILIIIVFLFTILSVSLFAKFIFSPSLALLTPPSSYPVEGLQWVKIHQWKGNILPHFEWGEYLIWNCYPDCHVGMDGRFETVYEQNMLTSYFDFLQGNNNWRNFLEKYPHDMVLLKTNSRTYYLMRTHPGWRLVNDEGGCALFLRK